MLFGSTSVHWLGVQAVVFHTFKRKYSSSCFDFLGAQLKNILQYSFALTGSSSTMYWSGIQKFNSLQC